MAPKDTGDDPPCDVILLLVGVSAPRRLLIVLLAVVVLFCRLETTVSGDHVSVQFGRLPVFHRQIRLRDIGHAEVCSYRPIRDFGGWGWGYGRGEVQAFTVKGSSGVCLTVRDGKRYLIGSERREELLRALQPRGIAE
jgi:hypothetical protein